MSKEEPSNITDMMDLLRDLRTTLEQIITKSIRDFETNTGLMVEDIELIRQVTMEGKTGTRITAVKIEMRL